MVLEMVKKAPKPDKMGAYSDDADSSHMESEETEQEEPDEDADDAAAMSAYEDFARLAGFKPSPGTFEAFKEAVTLAMKPEHQRLHPDKF